MWGVTAEIGASICHIHIINEQSPERLKNRWTIVHLPGRVTPRVAALRHGRHICIGYSVGSESSHCGDGSGRRCYDHHSAAVLCIALETGEARSPRVSHPRGIGKSRLDRSRTIKIDSCSQAIVYVDIAIQYIRGFSSFCRWVMVPTQLTGNPTVSIAGGAGRKVTDIDPSSVIITLKVCDHGKIQILRSSGHANPPNRQSCLLKLCMGFV